MNFHVPFTQLQQASAFCYPCFIYSAISQFLLYSPQMTTIPYCHVLVDGHLFFIIFSETMSNLYYL